MAQGTLRASAPGQLKSASKGGVFSCGGFPGHKPASSPSCTANLAPGDLLSTEVSHAGCFQVLGMRPGLQEQVSPSPEIPFLGNKPEVLGRAQWVEMLPGPMLTGRCRA